MTSIKNHEQILIVDDDPLSRKILVRALLQTGYVCRESSDGMDALRQVRADPPSLLLLDFDMPGLNGAEVLKQLRADQDPEIAQLPAIMLTGHGGEDSEVLCLEAGADDFVTKPINAAVLRARIETQLRLCSMRRQLQEQNDVLEAWRFDLEQDLAAARLTQQSLIPQKPPPLPGWEVAACYRPVIQVGGDIYGWLRMADRRTLFWIADATGHGASAALLTTLAKLLFHHGSVESNEPAEIMEVGKQRFPQHFRRAFLYDRDVRGVGSAKRARHRSRRRSSSAAGHSSRRRNGIVSFLSATSGLGRAIGIHSKSRLISSQVTLFFCTRTDFMARRMGRSSASIPNTLPKYCSPERRARKLYSTAFSNDWHPIKVTSLWRMIVAALAVRRSE